jgi:hypothetical protein
MASHTIPAANVSPILPQADLLTECLIELRVISIYLHAISGVKDEPEKLRADPAMKRLSNQIDLTT